MKCILALDIATKCGWCVWQEGQKLASGVWKLAAKSKELRCVRLTNLRMNLNDVLKAWPIDLIVHEDVGFVKYRDAHAVYNKLLSVVLVWGMDNQVEITSIPVKTIKKFATGKGNANKDMMVKAAEKRWTKHKFISDDEADARWVMATELDQLGLQESK